MGGECRGSLKYRRGGVKTLSAPLWAIVETTWESKTRLSLALCVREIWMPGRATGHRHEIFQRFKGLAHEEATVFFTCSKGGDAKELGEHL